jgi:Zn-dependent protease
MPVVPVVKAMLFAMLLGLPAMVLHECGHIAAARLCGVKVKKIGISWIGPFVLREAGPRWANGLISFSGPLVNLLLAAAWWSTMPSLAQVNLFIGIGSLLPLPKSDGRRIVMLVRSAIEDWTMEHQHSIPGPSRSPASVRVGMNGSL